MGYGFSTTNIVVLLYLILAVVAIAALPIVISLAMKSLTRRRPQGVRRGFEVKRTTGETPAPREEQ